MSSLLKCIDEEEDSLRIYWLREPKEQFIEKYGVNQAVDFEAPLVV